MHPSPSSDRFFPVTYRVRAPAVDIHARAQALALEQSVEVPLAAVRSGRVRDEVVARVADIADAGADGFDVVLELAVETTGLEATQLFNMLFGNCALQPDVTLVDAGLPRAVIESLGGPRHGIDGVRKAVSVPDRALTCTALKPQGLSAAELATLAGALARAGLDVIKDDHGIADQAAAPFAKRVAAVQRAVRSATAGSGRRCLYAPTLSGSPRRLLEQARVLAAEGVGMALACPALIGFGTFNELAREILDVPLLAHPAYSGVRVAPPLLFGTLFRALGADAVIFPNHGGRFSWSEAECASLARRARGSLHDCRAAFPVPAGGMRLERVEEMIRFYGSDTVLLIGGDVVAADDVEARARAFVDRVARAGCAEATGRRRAPTTDAPHADRPHGDGQDR